MEEKRKETPAQAGNSYLALDLETTGLDPKRDKIIEIGACRVRDGEIEKELSLLIHPHQPLPERITARQALRTKCFRRRRTWSLSSAR